MEIQIDSREKAKAIKSILVEFDSQGIKYFTSKLYCGDYQSLDNARLCIDRKQSLSELVSNVCQQHERFKAELIRANEANIKLVVLCEHGGKIKSLEDVRSWVNPRQIIWEKNIREDYNIPKNADFETEVAELKKHGAKITPPTSGEKLYKMLSTISERYSVEFLFCTKSDTGKRIVEIFGGNG
jgi:hypothetical protein